MSRGIKDVYAEIWDFFFLSYKQSKDGLSVKKYRFFFAV